VAREARGPSDAARSAGRRTLKPAASASQPPRNVRVPRARKADRPRGPGLLARLRGVGARLGATGRRLSRPLALGFKLLSVCAALGGTLLLGKLLQRHLTTSSAFAIDKIEIAGLTRMERAEVLATAGIAEGRNVFEHSPSEVQARLLKHPWVAEASVSRRLPGSFAIRLREREPVALLVVEPCADGQSARSDDSACDDGSALYLLSDDGKLFKRFDAKDPVDLPVVTGIDRARFGSDPEFQQTILLEVAQLLHDYKSQGLWAKLPISEIHVEPSDGFSLYVGSELTLVRLGVAPYAQKLPKMKKVFARLEQEHASAEYVYLDNEERPDRVTVRLR
jgi:cell division protein FtsQ